MGDTTYSKQINRPSETGFLVQGLENGIKMVSHGPIKPGVTICVFCQPPLQQDRRGRPAPDVGRGVHRVKQFERSLVCLRAAPPVCPP